MVASSPISSLVATTAWGVRIAARDRLGPRGHHGERREDAARVDRDHHPDQQREQPEADQELHRSLLAPAGLRGEARHRLLDARPHRAEALRALGLALHQIVARSLGAVAIADGERLEEPGEALRLGVERPLDGLDLAHDLVTEAAHRRIPVGAEPLLRGLPHQRERERPRAARGLDPLAHVARVLRGRDVVELRVEDVLLRQRLADAQEQRHVTTTQKLGVAGRGAQGEEAPPHGDREGREHEEVAAEQAIGDGAARRRGHGGARGHAQ
ncbi:MAG: hypothetical protein QM820_52635 [Minicystis sp.]